MIENILKLLIISGLTMKVPFLSTLSLLYLISHNISCFEWNKTFCIICSMYLKTLGGQVQCVAFFCCDSSEFYDRSYNELTAEILVIPG